MTLTNQPVTTGPHNARAGWRPQALALWAVVAVVTFFGGTIVENAGLPAPHLITGLVAGLVVALTGAGRRVGAVLPRVVYIAAQSIAGVLLGTYFSLSALGKGGLALIPLVAVTLLTLALSVGAGLLLARRTDLDEPTAALGMIAGGSPGSSPPPRTCVLTPAWSRSCSTPG